MEIYKTDIKSIFEKRKWTESGLAWIFYPDLSKNAGNEKNSKTHD